MSSTNPGSRSAAEIEAEVDHERERVADTIGALQSKLSAKSLVDDVSHALYEHGGDISRTLGRQLRDNPLPAILTGIGLAWLMAGSGPRPARGEGGWDRDVYRTGQPGDFAKAPDPARGGEDDGPGLQERAADWGGTVANAASDAVHSTRDALGTARDALSDGGRSMENAGRSAREWGSQQVQGIQAGLITGIEAQPLVFGGIAFALGAALGAALPHTRMEDEVVGPHADRVRQKVSEVASTEVEKAKAVASAVVDEGKQIAEEAADTLARNLPDAETLSGGTRDAALDAADRLRTAGEIEAERRKLGDPGTSA
jgi:hypothetical protein